MEAEAGTDADTTVSGEAKTIHVLACWDENTDSGQVLKTVTDRYNATNPETPIDLQFEVVAQDSMNQQLSVLAASNDLPDVFATGTQEYINDYVSQVLLKSIDEVIEEFGKTDALSAESREALLNLTKQDGLYVLPMDRSIEGIWYNKQIFEDNGLEVPKTMEEFKTVCETLLNNGIQPMVSPGKEKWPLTRLIGAYATMVGGTDVIVDANAGDISWGDDALLQAYAWLKDMGEKGYLGQGVTTIDTNTANSMFLNGSAAMYYNGSWFTSRLESDENSLGQNVGLFAFPTVEGGKGAANTYTTSYGMFWCFRQDVYDEAEGQWIAYMLENYGDVAMEIQGRLTAYTLHTEPEVGYFTQLIQDCQDNAGGSGLWPEYAMPTSIQDVEYSNAQMLVLGQMEPEEFAETMDAAMKAAQ